MGTNSLVERITLERKTPPSLRPKKPPPYPFLSWRSHYLLVYLLPGLLTILSYCHNFPNCLKILQEFPSTFTFDTNHISMDPKFLQVLTSAFLFLILKKYMIFKGYFPFIVITKYWLYLLCCTIHP